MIGYLIDIKLINLYPSYDVTCMGKSVLPTTTEKSIDLYFWGGWEGEI